MDNIQNWFIDHYDPIEHPYFSAGFTSIGVVITIAIILLVLVGLGYTMHSDSNHEDSISKGLLWWQDNFYPWIWLSLVGLIVWPILGRYYDNNKAGLIKEREERKKRERETALLSNALNKPLAYV